MAERDLAKFDREAWVARYRNRKFTAKNIRNNMMLYKSKKNVIRLNNLSKKISSMFASREVVWNDQQHVKLKERVELN